MKLISLLMRMNPLYNEADEMDEMEIESSDPNEVQNIMLLLQKLKELSGTNLSDFAP